MSGNPYHITRQILLMVSPFNRMFVISCENKFKKKFDIRIQRSSFLGLAQNTKYLNSIFTLREMQIVIQERDFFFFPYSTRKNGPTLMYAHISPRYKTNKLYSSFHSVTT